MGQHDLGRAGLCQRHGKPGGILVAEVALFSQNALLQIIGIGAAAERLDVVIGFQHRQVHAGQDLGCLVGDISRVRQKPHTAVGGIHTVIAGTGSVMGGGEGGDGAGLQGKRLTKIHGPEPVLNARQAVGQPPAGGRGAIDGKSGPFQQRL